MMGDVRQLPLELALEPRFGEEDFLVSHSNSEAYARIEIWPDWPSKMLLLEGPTASGKSHLASIWAARSGARQLSARALGKAEIPALVAAGAVVVEDIDRVGVDEAALFHLVNLAAERTAFILFSATKQLNEWSIQTPDLLSRIRRIPKVAIAPPDDALIRALFVKLFVDRQLVVDTALVEYLCLRIERSFKAVRATVEKLDRETMARGKRLTRPAAAQILGFTNV
jgi:chromosomal replication initiation ATPase DnaA